MSAPKAGSEPAPARMRYFEITVALHNDGEPREIFVSPGTVGDFLIKRGEKVVVPEPVMEVLDHAVAVATEPKEDGNGVVQVPRQRFAYTVHREVARP